jgi:hypothetical protein
MGNTPFDALDAGDAVDSWRRLAYFCKVSSLIAECTGILKNSCAMGEPSSMAPIFTTSPSLIYTPREGQDTEEGVIVVKDFIAAELTFPLVMTQIISTKE